MWFIGAVAGGVLGAWAGQGAGFFFGAAVGGFAGWALSPRWTRRLDALEARMASLEKGLAQPVAPAVPAAPVPERPRASMEPAESSSGSDAPRPTPRRLEPEAAVSPPVPSRTASAPVPETPRPAPSPTLWPGLWERLLGGNLVVKVGIVVLFFGVAFLLKYTYERVHVPIELRLTGAALGAIALLAVGWLLREKRPGYALALQGGGVGILYLVIFAAFRLFHLLPAPLTFALLVGVAVASAMLSVIQNSLSLAAIGVSGGFLAPLLASTGQGSHVMLFSYYAVLNAGIVAIAWLKAWRALNILGFAFTFVIGWLWGARAYQPEYFGSTEPFLLLFFAMYVAIPLLFARRRAIELKDYVDGTLIFGVPIAAFGLQVALVRGIEYGAAYSALGLALVYLVLALALFRRTGGGLRLLVESFVALSLAFGTLAIPLAFDGRLTSAAWALEGAAVVWIAMRQGRLLARAFGYLLQFIAGFAFLKDVGKGYDATPVLNSFYLGSVFLALAAFFCAAYIERNHAAGNARLREEESGLAYVLLAWGALWWFGGGLHEIGRHVAAAHRMHSGLMFVAASSVAFSVVSAWCRWPSARWLRLALYPAMIIQLGEELRRGGHPFAGLGAAAWAVALASHFWLLSRHAEDQGPRVRELNGGLHAAGVWLIALLGARELGWLIDTVVEGKRVWPSISWAIVPAAVLAALGTPRLQAIWPVRAHTREYVVAGGAPLAVFLSLWIFHANLTSDGDPYPLVYLPLLNPLDIAIGAVFLVIAAWLRAAAGHGLQDWIQRTRAHMFALFGVAGFVWINAMLLRSLHHWAGLPFALQPMLSSRLVQAAFAILWMLLALGTMVVATRRGLRPVWIAGAGLMGVVVAKLFLIDLSHVGTVERIVSFIGVGVLMLLIGYLSPVPPRVEVKLA